MLFLCWNNNRTPIRLSPGDLLLDGLSVGLSEQIEHGAAEVMSVAVGVAQLIGDRIQEQIAPWKHMTAQHVNNMGNVTWADVFRTKATVKIAEFFSTCQLLDRKLMWFLCCHLTLSVQVYGQVLEDVHVRRVSDSAHGGGAALVVDVSDCLCAYVQH